MLGVLRDNLVTTSYYSLLRIQQIEIPNEGNHSMTIDAPAIPFPIADSANVAYHDGTHTADRTRRPSQLLSVFTFFTDNNTPTSGGPPTPLLNT